MVRSEEVRHVAALARLTLADDELDEAARQLGRVLEHMELLREAEGADEDGPTAGEMGLRGDDRPGALRPDEIGEVLSRPEALASAPHTDGETFLVPPVLEEGEGS